MHGLRDRAQRTVVEAEARQQGNFVHDPARFGMPRIQGVLLLSDAANGYPLAVMDSIKTTLLRAEHGIDTAIMGPSGAGAHAAVEWVDLASVVQLADILARTAARFCGPPA